MATERIKVEQKKFRHKMNKNADSLLESLHDAYVYNTLQLDGEFSKYDKDDLSK